MTESRTKRGTSADPKHRSDRRKVVRQCIEDQRETTNDLHNDPLARFARSVAAGLVLVTVAGTSSAESDIRHERNAGLYSYGAITITIDIAQDPFLTIIDADSVPPERGDSFVTQGYIYPAGTLDGTSGVLPDGGPEFPGRVLGTWMCRGWLIGALRQTSSRGPRAIRYSISANGRAATPSQQAA